MNDASLDIPNIESSRFVWIYRNDAVPNGSQIRNMEKRQPDWHLRAWMAHFDKKQAALTNELGWNKSRANHVWHSRQEYRRETVNEVAAWLGIEPYELLMPPADALAIRELRKSAAIIASLTKPL